MAKMSVSKIDDPGSSPGRPANLTERQAVEPLLRGETVFVRGIGNSMTPLLKSGQVVTVEPISLSDVRKGDIVLSKVRGNIYLHKVTAVRPGLVQISNNHGHINGWTSQVYGKVIDA